MFSCLCVLGFALHRNCGNRPPPIITHIIVVIFFLGMLIATIYSLIKFRVVEDWEKTPEGKKLKRRNIRRRIVKAIFLISSAYIFYDRWDDFLTIVGDVVGFLGFLFLLPGIVGMCIGEVFSSRKK